MCTPTATNPSIVIVHGAWHPPALYRTFVNDLRAASFDAFVPALPSLDSSNPASATCGKDADVVHATILHLLDQGKDVIVVAHSYGGIPAAGGAYGLGVEARKRVGEKGGVIGLVYMSAFVVPEGTSVLTTMGGRHAPYLVPDQPTPNNSIVSNATQIFYNDLPPEEAAEYASLLRPHSMIALDSPSPPAAWAEPDFAARLGFLRCMSDNALPPSIQDLFTHQSGIKWDVVDVNAGHAPFLGKGKGVVDHLRRWAGEWKSRD